MKEFCDAMDNLPLIVKIILALPALDIIWAIYRIFKSAMKENWTGVLIAVIFIFLGLFPVAIFDMIYLALKQENVWWLD